MQFHWEMSELTLFWDMMSQNSHSQSDAQTSKLREVISNSNIKLPAQQYQPLSLHHYHCMATHCCHRHQQSHDCHLSAAAPMLPAPATTWKTMTTRWDGWRRVRRVGRRGKGDREGDNNAVCNPHAASSISFPLLFDDMACNPHTVSSILFPPCCLMMQCATHTPHRLFLSLHVFWWCGMQPTCHVSFFFPSMLFDDVACNPHATLSISFYFYSYIYS